LIGVNLYFQPITLTVFLIDRIPHGATREREKPEASLPLLAMKGATQYRSSCGVQFPGLAKAFEIMLGASLRYAGAVVANDNAFKASQGVAY
jgi:hypothetical protein